MTVGDRSAPRTLAAAVLAAAATIGALAYRPTTLAENFGAASVAHLAVVFAAWALAVFSWGWTAQRAFTGSNVAGPRQLSLAICFGSLGFGALAYVLFAAGRTGFRTVSLGLVAVGVFLLVFRPPERRPVPDRATRVFAAALAVYALVRFVQVTRLSRHGDPLYYHLVAPVMWVRSGSMAFDASHPFNYQGSIWEGLYLWPAEWLLGPGTTGLPAIQVFAQWTHAVFGWLGLGIAAAGLLRALRFSPFASLLGAFAALATYSMWWTGGLAKNDCGAALFTLGAAQLLLTREESDEREGRRLMAGGLFAGAAFATKFTAAFAVGPLLAAWATSEVLRRKTPRVLRCVVLVAAGGALAAGPVLLRNSLATGAAAFPIGIGAGSASLSESSREYLGALSPFPIDASLGWRVARLGEFLRETTLSPAFLLAPFILSAAAVGRRRLSSERATLLAAAVGSVCLFLLLAHPGTDLRLLGAGIVLASAAGAVTTYLFLRKLSRRFLPGRSVPLGLFVALAIAATCRFAPESIVDRWRELPLQKAIATHTAGEAKIWAATRLGPDARIVTTGDDELYYLLGSSAAAAATDDVPLDRLWRTELARGASAAEVLEAFRSRGFTHLLDTRFPGEVPRLAAVLRPAFDAHPEWVAFEGADARIIELRKVVE